MTTHAPPGREIIIEIQLMIRLPRSRGSFVVEPRTGTIKMPDYRLFFLAENGKIFRNQIVTAETDEEACAAARKLDHAYAIEVWQRTRKVATIYPEKQ